MAAEVECISVIVVKDALMEDRSCEALVDFMADVAVNGSIETMTEPIRKKIDKRLLKGIAASPGIVIGRAYVFHDILVLVEKQGLEAPSTLKMRVKVTEGEPIAQYYTGRRHHENRDYRYHRRERQSWRDTYEPRAGYRLFLHGDSSGAGYTHL